MSHLKPNACYVPDLGEFNGYKGKVIAINRGTDTDRTALYQIAGNIKRHIEHQLTHPEDQEREMRHHPPNRKASEWEIDTVYAMRIFFHPLDQLNRVLPEELEPSTDRMNEFAVLLDNSVNEAFFGTPGLWNAVNARDKGLRPFITSMSALLRRDQDDSEDKEEVYTDTMLRSLLQYLGVGDPNITNVVLEENVDLTTELGQYSYQAKVEFGFTLQKYFRQPGALAFAFVEDKRLKSKGPQTIVAQRIAEALAFADTNFDTLEGDQEIFGICVRHRYFTFWHGVFPKAYLDCIRDSPDELKENQFFGIVKCFPESNFGLDICDPGDRAVILRGIFRLFKYIEKEFRV